MKNSKYFLIVFLSMVIFSATTFIRYHSFISDFWITPILFFIFVILCSTFKNAQPQKVLVSTILGLLTIFAIAFFFDGAPSKITYPNLLAYFGGIFAGYFFSIHIKYMNKIVPFIALIIFCLFYQFIFKNYWENYVEYRTFKGISQVTIKNKIKILAENKDTITLHNFGTTYVLDCWFIGCAPCVKAFPKFENLYQKYTSKKDYVFYSINYPNESDTNSMALNMVRKLGYTFPLAYEIKSTKPLLDVNTFPTILVIRNDSILYRGKIELVEKFLDKN